MSYVNDRLRRFGMGDDEPFQLGPVTTETVPDRPSTPESVTFGAGNPYGGGFTGAIPGGPITGGSGGGGGGGSGGGSSFWDKLTGAGGSLLGAAQAGAKASGAANAYQAALYQQSATPAWLMPVAVGGIALVAVMMLTAPKRSAPASNPARRRRRRR